YENHLDSNVKAIRRLNVNKHVIIFANCHEFISRKEGSYTIIEVYTSGSERREVVVEIDYLMEDKEQRKSSVGSDRRGLLVLWFCRCNGFLSSRSLAGIVVEREREEDDGGITAEQRRGWQHKWGRCLCR
ncbi:hypothetical protein HAX54_028229, partial [Datura stramonium]|nr:hypothetical protein [Datura stramonium]